MKYEEWKYAQSLKWYKSWCKSQGVKPKAAAYQK